MAHDILKDSVEAQTFRASVLIVGILLGGVLILCSYLAPLLPIFSDATFESEGQSHNFYAAILALGGAILLGIPIIVHAAKGIFKHAVHMDELVALAVVAERREEKPERHDERRPPHADRTADKPVVRAREPPECHCYFGIYLYY